MSGDDATTSDLPYSSAIVREYLLFRGFRRTARCFDEELVTANEAQSPARDHQVKQLMDLIFSSYIPSLHFPLLQDLFQTLRWRFPFPLGSPEEEAMVQVQASLVRRYLVHAAEVGALGELLRVCQGMASASLSTSHGSSGKGGSARNSVHMSVNSGFCGTPQAGPVHFAGRERGEEGPLEGHAGSSLQQPFGQFSKSLSGPGGQGSRHIASWDMNSLPGLIQSNAGKDGAQCRREAEGMPASRLAAGMLGACLLPEAELYVWISVTFLPGLPQEHPALKVYFTTAWKEMVLLSTFNLLSVVLGAVDVPLLMRFNVERQKRRQVEADLEASQQELTSLRQQLSGRDDESASSLSGNSNDSSKRPLTHSN